MERDSLSRTPDSPAFYEERIRLLEAEQKRLRDALRSVMNELGVPQPGYLQPVVNAYEVARIALDGTS